MTSRGAAQIHNCDLYRTASKLAQWDTSPDTTAIQLDRMFWNLWRNAMANGKADLLGSF